MNPYKKNLEKSAELSKTTAKQDKVEISTAAKDLQTNEVSNGRQEKLNEIKSQIESGTYTVDPKAVAKGLLKFYQK